MKTINGQTLKEMFISGANNLYNHYPEIDALNVFPVPDGDTGMNMNLTMSSGCKEIQNRVDTNIFEISKSFSRGLLMGARGNSGVITSQIFRGFSQGLEGKIEADALDVSNAFQKGVEVAYKAVIRPVEGTILTVIREASECLHDQVNNNQITIDKAFDILINEAKASLKRTPDLLPILKEVGVIDSGGAGLIKILEGMRKALFGSIVERNEATSVINNSISAAGASIEEEEFGYCTEFIMSLGPDSVKNPFNENRFKMVLGNHGNSLVVVHDEDIVKVHVHTMTPGVILNYAQQFGEFLKLKIENMTEQHHALETGAAVDPHVDLVEEPVVEKEEHALIAVSAGAGIDALFEEIGVKVIVKGGQTMNPSSEDFVSAIKKANAKNIYIFPNNSNIVMAASQACEMVNDPEMNVYVIPSKTIPQGISSIVNFNCEEDGETNFRNMRDYLKNVKSGEVTYSIRDTQINGVDAKKGDFIAIKDKDMVASSNDLFNATKSLIESMIDEDSALMTVFVGEGVEQEQADKIEQYMSENHPDVELDIRQGDQPVYYFLIGVE